MGRRPWQSLRSPLQATRCKRNQAVGSAGHLHRSRSFRVETACFAAPLFRSQGPVGFLV